MAFTFDAKVESNATSTGLTVSHTCGAGADLLVVGIAIRGNQTITSVKYGGVDLTSAVDKLDANDPERTAIWYLVNPASGANNVVLALSASVEHRVSVSSYFADNTPALDVVASDSNGLGTDSTPSAALTGAVGGLAVDACSSEENASPPMTGNGADQTVLFNSGSGSYGLASSYELSPASNEQFDWTQAGTNTWVMCVACFKEAAGGGAAAGVQIFHPLLPFLKRARKVFGPYFTPFPVPAGAITSVFTESPTPGGAVADGFGPTVTVPVAQGGAVAAGTAPTARVSVPQGGAIGDGFGPTARVSVTIGGAVAGGSSPTAQSSVSQGGATAAGFGPSPARVAITIGGATAGGFSPTDGSAVQETPTPGGAIAGGNGPTAQVSVTQGGAVAAGTSPSPARVTLTIGGAVAGGNAPTPSPSVTIGGASTGGFGGTVRVSLTIGGAIAGGNAPFVPGSQVPASLAVSQFDRYDITATSSLQDELTIAQNGRQSVEGTVSDKAGVTGSGGSKASVS